MDELKIMATRGVHEIAFQQINKLDLPFDTNFLEVGAGEGAFSSRLLEKGFKFIDAIDIKADKFKISQLKCFQIDLNSNFSEKIKKKYDFIIGIEVIEHLENPSHFFRECFNLLKNKGFLLITTPNIESWFSRVLFFRNGHFHWFSEKAYFCSGHIPLLPSWILVEFSKKAGFNLVSFATTPNKELFKKILSYSNMPKKFIKVCIFTILYPFMQGNKKGEISIYLLRKNYQSTPS